jgi:hypothetical protein
MADPQMIPVSSSNIKAVGYDAPAKALHIDFNSGSYIHAGVPSEIHSGLMSAESKGKYYHANIKGKFEATKKEAKQ